MVTTWGSSGAEEASSGQTSGAWAHKGPIDLLLGSNATPTGSADKGKTGLLVTPRQCRALNRKTVWLRANQTAPVGATACIRRGPDATQL
ncbi:hypothetical protein GCM10027346_14420 [Hymenobacter seoulensis]